MMKLNHWQSWKRRFLLDEPAAGEGGAGSGGGSGSGAGSGEGDAGDKGKDGEGSGSNGAAGGGAGGEGGGSGGAPAIPEATQKELDRLKKFEQSASAHLEVDPTTGEYRPKARTPAPDFKQPTAEEIEQARFSNEIAEKSAALIELNRSAEQKTMDKFKAEDPLFSQNFIKAREKVMGLPASQRTEIVWDRAYSMAQGEMMRTGAYAKHYKEQGKQEALTEFAKQGDMVLPASSGEGAGSNRSKKVDVSKIVLNSAQKDAAVRLIRGGFINSMDEYKENMAREEMEVDA